MIINRVDESRLKEVLGKSYKRTKIQKIVESFEDNGYKIAELELEAGEYTKLSSAYTSVWQYLRRSRKDSAIGVCVADGKLYIYRKDLPFEDGE